MYITTPRKPRNGICKTYVIICWHSGWILSVSFNVWRKNARARAVPSGLLYWKFSSFGQQYLQSFQKNLYRSACVPTPIYNTRVQHCAGVNITGEDAIQLNGQIKKFPKRDRVSFIRAIAFFHRILLKCFRARPFPFPPLLPPPSPPSDANRFPFSTNRRTSVPPPPPFFSSLKPIPRNGWTIKSLISRPIS